MKPIENHFYFSNDDILMLKTNDRAYTSQLWSKFIWIDNTAIMGRATQKAHRHCTTDIRSQKRFRIIRFFALLLIAWKLISWSHLQFYTMCAHALLCISIGCTSVRKYAVSKWFPIKLSRLTMSITLKISSIPLAAAIPVVREKRLATRE